MLHLRSSCTRPGTDSRGFKKSWEKILESFFSNLIFPVNREKANNHSEAELGTGSEVALQLGGLRGSDGFFLSFLCTFNQLF